jgi:type VI secretion system protein ImpH
MALPDEALYSRAGLLAMAPVPAVVLESLLRSYFGVEARVQQFLPAWYSLDEESRSRLGAASATLGVDLALGERVRLAEFRFRVRLGPLTLVQYEDFLPGSGGFDALFDLVRLAVTPEQTFEVRPVLRREEVPLLALSQTGRCRLGRTTWLAPASGARSADAADAVFHSEHAALTRAARLPRTLENAA